MKLQKFRKIIFLIGLLFIFGMLFVPSPGSAVATTSWISTSYDRINVDRVDVTAIANFTLEANYTLLKLYYAIWPSDTDAGTAIATSTVDYNNYNNATSGTVGEVQQSSVIVAYDGNAQDVNIFGGDKVYLRLYIYNNSVSTSNLIVKTSIDTDYWPLGGRYSAPATTATTTTEKGTSWTTYAMYGGAGVIVVILGITGYMFFSKHISVHSPRDTIEYSDGRKAYAKRWQNEGHHKDKTSGNIVHHMPGQFKDIQSKTRADSLDRRGYNQHTQNDRPYSKK